MNLNEIDTIIAIDVGAGGGIAIWRNMELQFYAISTVNMPKSINKMNEYFRYLIDISENVICFIEHVQMYIGDAKDGKQFGIVKMLANYEQLKSVLTICKIPYVPVYPITWQSKLKLRIKGEEKNIRKRRYKGLAQIEHPGIKVTLKTCDALMILKFARVVLRNDKEWVKKHLSEPLGLIN